MDKIECLLSKVLHSKRYKIQSSRRYPNGKIKVDRKFKNRVHDLVDTPRDAWKVVTTLKELIQGHHKSPDIVRLKNNNCLFSKTNE